MVRQLLLFCASSFYSSFTPSDVGELVALMLAFHVTYPEITTDHPLELLFLVVGELLPYPILPPGFGWGILGLADSSVLASLGALLWESVRFL